MRLIEALRAYPANADPFTSACNWIALIVAWNQPLYPFYVRWAVGGDWQVAFWTFLSTPFFLAVPAVARRSSLAGRAMLPLTGIANGLLSIKAFGPASGVSLFLIPCGLIAALGFRRIDWQAGSTLLIATLLGFAFSAHAGTPLGHFDTVQYRHFFRLNAISVITLSLVILWSLWRPALGRN